MEPAARQGLRPVPADATPLSHRDDDRRGLRPISVRRLVVRLAAVTAAIGPPRTAAAPARDGRRPRSDAFDLARGGLVEGHGSLLRVARLRSQGSPRTSNETLSIHDNGVLLHAFALLRTDQGRQVRLRRLVLAKPRPRSLRRSDPSGIAGPGVHQGTGPAQLLRLRVPRQRHHPLQPPAPPSAIRLSATSRKPSATGASRPRWPPPTPSIIPSSRTAPSPAPTRPCACTRRRR